MQALRSLGEPLSEPILSSVLREVDPNGDNQFNIDSESCASVVPCAELKDIKHDGNINLKFQGLGGMCSSVS